MPLLTPSCFLLRALRLAGLAAILAGAAPLRADDSSLYAGVGYGAAVLESTDAAGSLPGSQPDTRAIRPATEHLVATSVFGGYRLGPGLAVEGARVSLAGAMAAPDTPLAASAERAAVWSVSSVGSVPLDDSLSLFARVGLNYPEAERQIGSAAQLDELGRVYGLGLRFAPSERVDLRAEMQHLTRGAADGASDASVMTFGARIRF